MIAVIQSELSLFQPDLAHAFSVSTASLTGLTEAVPLIIILVVTVFSGRARPTAGEMAARLPLPGSGRVARRRRSRWPSPPAVVLIVGVPSYADALIVTFGIGIIIASVVVVSGYAGQLSLCQYRAGGIRRMGRGPSGQQLRRSLRPRGRGRRGRRDGDRRAGGTSRHPHARSHVGHRHVGAVTRRSARSSSRTRR